MATPLWFTHLSEVVLPDHKSKVRRRRVHGALGQRLVAMLAWAQRPYPPCSAASSGCARDSARRAFGVLSRVRAYSGLVLRHRGEAAPVERLFLVTVSGLDSELLRCATAAAAPDRSPRDLETFGRLHELIEQALDLNPTVDAHGVIPGRSTTQKAAESEEAGESLHRESAASNPVARTR